MSASESTGRHAATLRLQLTGGSARDSLDHPCTTTAWSSEGKGEGDGTTKGDGAGTAAEEEERPTAVASASASPIVHASKANSRVMGMARVGFILTAEGKWRANRMGTAGCWLNRIESNRVDWGLKAPLAQQTDRRTADDSPHGHQLKQQTRATTQQPASSMSHMQSGSQPGARHRHQPPATAATAAEATGAASLRDPPAALSAAAAAVTPQSESPSQRLLTELAQLKHTQKKIKQVEQQEEEKMAQLRRSAGAASSAPLCSVLHAGRAATAAADGHRTCSRSLTQLL